MPSKPSPRSFCRDLPDTIGCPHPFSQLVSAATRLSFLLLSVIVAMVFMWMLAGSAFPSD